VSLAVTRTGAGPEVLLVHGGSSPAATWAGLESLAARWTLAYVHRRGFPPSPPPAGRQDFEVDAADLDPLLGSRPHVVAHSYGAVGALLAAERRAPGTLTLIEPPYYRVPGDAEVDRLRRRGDEFLAHGLDTEPSKLREFLRLAGSPVPDEGPLPEAVVRAVQRAHGGRPPSEARLDLGAVRDAAVRTLVVSGGHHPAMERMCDALADGLGGERLVAAGAGHFVAAAPGFAERLEEFLSR
jgi:pimeloyl-ACP methyl ester carboxylesterase